VLLLVLLSLALTGVDPKGWLVLPLIECLLLGGMYRLLCCLLMEQENFEVLELLPMLLLGVIGGLLGSTFNYLNTHLAALRKVGGGEGGERGGRVEGEGEAMLHKPTIFWVIFLTLVDLVVQPGLC
jgi:hypothetical protein